MEPVRAWRRVRKSELRVSASQGVSLPGTFRTVLRPFRTVQDTLRGLGLLKTWKELRLKEKWLRRFEVTRIGKDYPKNRSSKLKIHPYGQNVKFLFTKPVKSSLISTLK